MSRIVLIADDSPTIQNKAKGILTGEGLEVFTVSNGVAAIKKLPQVNPALILADVAMPGRDGYEVCDFVKNSPELRHIPVVLIFSDSDPYNEEQGARVRADGKIRKMAAGKPFDPEELISTVSGFLAQAGSSSAAHTPAAEPAVVLEPVDEEPKPPTRRAVDLSSLPQGAAFADPMAVEFPSLSPEQAPAPLDWVTQADSALGATPAEELTAPAEPLPAEESGGQEPVLIEEPPAGPPSPPPKTQRTMLFRAPSDIAEPLLNDELATPPPPSPRSIKPPPSVPGSEPGRAADTTLGNFSLGDATAGEVRFASQRKTSHEIGPEPGAELPPAPPETVSSAAGHETSIDARLVHSIVQKVMAKMSPPALSQEVIEEMARKLAGEILTELIAESS